MRGEYIILYFFIIIIIVVVNLTCFNLIPIQLSKLYEKNNFTFNILVIKYSFEFNHNFMTKHLIQRLFI